MEIDIQLQSPESKRTTSVKALINLGGNGLFIDERWAEEQGWRMNEANVQMAVHNIDRTKNIGGNIKHKVELLIKSGDHQERAIFSLTNLGTN